MHEHDASLDPLKNQLSNLDQLFQEFAAKFESAANSLREGYVPDPIPNIQLDAARQVFEDTLTAITDSASAFDLDPMPENPSLRMATAYFDRVIEAHIEAERQRRMIEEAFFVVEAAKALQSDSSPETMLRVHETIEYLLQELEEKNLEEAGQLVSGEHPLAMLAAYAGHRDTLNDDEYDAFRESIEAAFGRSVLRDIDRGRIVLSRSEDAVVEAEEESDAVESPENFEFEQEEEIEAVLEVVDSSDEDFDEDFDEEDEDALDGEIIEEMIPEEEILTDVTFLEEVDESEDSMWSPLEGDGFDVFEDETPEASLHEEDEENKDWD